MCARWRAGKLPTAYSAGRYGWVRISTEYYGVMGEIGNPAFAVSRPSGSDNTISVSSVSSVSSVGRQHPPKPFVCFVYFVV